MTLENQSSECATKLNQQLPGMTRTALFIEKTEAGLVYHKAFLLLYLPSQLHLM